MIYSQLQNYLCVASDCVYGLAKKTKTGGRDMRVYVSLPLSILRLFARDEDAGGVKWNRLRRVATQRNAN